MSAYVPEFVYGFAGWDERNQPTYGLVPWPAHLQPREAVELTKKGEAYASANLADALPDVNLAEMFGELQSRHSASIEAGGVFFLTITKGDRTSIATTIERLLVVLDAMDGDENLEATGDDEPSHGWTGEGRGTVGLDTTVCHDDDREEENEHGGDILAEPHDAIDSGDDEPFLGWHETCGQGAVGLEGWSAADQPGMLLDVEGSLHFDGDGYRDGQKLLRELRERHPGRQQNRVTISPAIGRRP